MWEMLVALDVPHSTTKIIPAGGPGVQSLTLGLAGPSVACITSATNDHPVVFSVLCRWFSESFGHMFFTSVQVNRYFSCERHRDSGNLGVSAIKALGVFSGGELLSSTGLQTTVVYLFETCRSARQICWMFEHGRYLMGRRRMQLCHIRD